MRCVHVYTMHEFTFWNNTVFVILFTYFSIISTYAIPPTRKKSKGRNSYTFLSQQ